MSEVPLYFASQEDSGRRRRRGRATRGNARGAEREFFIDNLLVRIHFIIVMIRWTGHAPWGFEFPFPGSLTSRGRCDCEDRVLDEHFRPLTPNTAQLMARGGLVQDLVFTLLVGRTITRAGVPRS